MSFLTDNSAQATKMFIVLSKIGVHQILCNNTDTEGKGYLYVWDDLVKQMILLKQR